ncbi:MAG: HDOD domain-containing protein, partial [Armatimonadetes bacterium]|nr:HDOD domain-containing protein [Armatimonadota bacterium]
MKVLESLRLKLRRGELATLPFVMQSLLSALSDPHSSAKQLGRVIETDQALSASVLRLANSAYYGLSQQVSDMQQAVTLVGYSALRELVMSITSYDLIFRSGSVTYDRQELWSHSLQVACGSRVLARRFPKVPQEVVFVAGILHDVGMTLMDQHAHSLFVTIVSTAKQMNQSQYAVEKNLVGVTHAEVGQWAAEAWNLPPVLQSAIRYHHDPQNAGPHRLAASIVAMADALCHDPYTLDTDEVALMRQVGDFLGLPEPDWP